MNEVVKFLNENPVQYVTQVNIGFLSSLTLYLLIVGVLLAFANAHYMPSSFPFPRRRATLSPHRKISTVRSWFLGGFLAVRQGSSAAVPCRLPSHSAFNGQTSHRRALPGRQMTSPNSISAWVKSPSRPSGYT